MSKERKQEIAATILGVSVAIILWLTIFRREGVTENPLAYQSFHSFSDFWKDIIKNGIKGNFLGNILIFIPVGVLYPMAFGKKKPRWYKTVVFGFCLSLFVELMQLIFSKGYFEIDDMILNTAGAWIGYALFKLLLG